MANILILHLEQDIFKDAIIATAQHFGIREVYIEKDYWVTWILKNLAQSAFKNETIFKGGTSLSKAFGCIDRFSEDIDLAIIINNVLNREYSIRPLSIEEPRLSMLQYTLTL